MTPEIEFVDTEEKYINDMNYMITAYLNPLEKWIEELKISFEHDTQNTKTVLYGVIKRDEINVINTLFSNIKQLVLCNEVILQQLQAALGIFISCPTWTKLMYSGDRLKLCRNFSRVAPTLKFYSDYTKNYKSALALLERLRGDIRCCTYFF